MLGCDVKGERQCGEVNGVVGLGGEMDEKFQHHKLMESDRDILLTPLVGQLLWKVSVISETRRRSSYLSDTSGGHHHILYQAIASSFGS